MCYAWQNVAPACKLVEHLSHALVSGYAVINHIRYRTPYYLE
jgi:hypothetical protein